MGRPKKSIHQAQEGPSSAELIWRQQSSKQLAEEWDANAAWHDQWRQRDQKTAGPRNPGVYDPDLGLGPLWRAHLLRDVFKNHVAARW